ncbi:unnamed protein product [Phaeothamnion confervicola]
MRRERERLLPPSMLQSDGGTFVPAHGGIIDSLEGGSANSATSSRCASPFSSAPGLPQQPPNIVVGNRMRSWSGGRHHIGKRRHSLESYDFNKPDWVNLDMFQSMSAVLRQDLYIYDGPSRSQSAFFRLWAIVQTPCLVLAVGAITGALGLLVAVSERRLFALRWMWLTVDPAKWWYWVCYALQSMGLALLSCAVTQWFCPSATGGGIPEMKTVLSGAINPGILSTRLVTVKLTGMVLAKTAGLSVGKEGPLVHAACAVAEVLMAQPLFRSVRVATAKRLEMLACACAAGVAASFGSAFGATLFSVEVTATTYMVECLPRSFMAAVTVVLVFWATGTLDMFALFSEDTEQATRWEGFDLLAWACLGVICGLLGCFFVACVHRLSRWRNHLTRKALGTKMQRRRRFMVVAIFTAIVIPIAYLEMIYYDSEVGLDTRPHALVDQMFMPRSFGLSLHLVLYVPLKFVQTMFSVTQPLPVGLFSPVFLMGSAIGRVFGETLRYLETYYGLQHINFAPWEFAVIGSAAFSAGVTRAVSTAIIVFELSGENHLRLPLGVALLLAYMIGNRFTKDVYESLIDVNTLPWLPEMPPEAFTIQAEEVMIDARKLPVLGLDSTYADALHLLHHYKEHAIIPVVQTRRDMLLVGVILRHDLEVAVEDFEGHILVAKEEPVVLGRAHVRPDTPPTPPTPLGSGISGSFGVFNGNGNGHHHDGAVGPGDRSAGTGGGGKGGGWPLEYSPRQAAARRQRDNGKGVGGGRGGGGGGAGSASSGAASMEWDYPTPPRNQRAHSPRRGGVRRAASGGFSELSPSSEARVVEEHKDTPLQFIIIKDGNKFVPVAGVAPDNGGNGANGGSGNGDTKSFQRRAASGAASIPVVLDPSPYQVMHTTELRKVDLAFRMLKLDVAWVCQAGRLVGLITRGCLRRFIGKRDKRPLDDCRRLCRAMQDYCCFEYETEVVGVENYTAESLEDYQPAPV